MLSERDSEPKQLALAVAMVSESGVWTREVEGRIF